MNIENDVVRHNWEKLSAMKQEINKVKLEKEEDGGIVARKQSYAMSVLVRVGFWGDQDSP